MLVFTYMAMSKCKECGKSISTLAKTCPGCGAPNPTRTSSSKSKKESYRPKGLVQILAAIGLVVAILWTAKGLFQFGSAGYKQVTNQNKKEKNVTKILVNNFTCEGEVISSFRGDTGSSGLFIDEYTVFYDANQRIESLQVESNNYYARRFQFNNISTTSSSISFGEGSYKIGEGSDTVYVDGYQAKISLGTGTFSGKLTGTYDRAALVANYNGKCFGIDKIIAR